MVHQLVAKIRKLLRHTPWFVQHHISPWHREVIDLLNRAAAVTDVFDLLMALEALVADRIGEQLGQYNIQQAIVGQTDRSQEILEYASTLYEVYLLAAQHARHPRFINAGGPDMATVATNIRIQAGQPKKTRQFLETVDRFVMLSLQCATRAAVGARLVNKLALTNADVVIRVVWKETPSSLLAFNGAGQPFCQAGAAPIHLNPSTKQRVKPVVKGGGAASDIGAPVWFDDGVTSAGMLQHLSFNNQSVDEALRKILIGSLSFNSSRYPFYTPPRIELLHELIHVLHNARGSNRVNIQNVLNQNEQHAWHNAEEYWTIAGGNITENSFNSLIGLPARYGHGGVTLRGLDPNAPEAQESLATLSGF
ncbi:MAG: hypothetical protein JNJ46_20890 [Myxococcales bacterium]|nr:hypothetical protein [Myxococcales bacterium]